MKNTTHLEDFLSYMKLVKNLSGNTISAYRIDINEFFSGIGKGENDITTRDITRYVCELSKNGIAPASVCRKVSAIRAYYKWAKKEGIVTIDNPTDDVDLPQIPHKEPKALTDEQVNDMLNAIEGNEFNAPRDRLIISLMVVCGMRKSELLNITLSDVDTKEMSIRIRHGKGDKERYCYYNDAVQELLVDYLDNIRGRSKYAKDSEYLFISQCSGRLSRSQLSNIVDNLLTKIGAKEKGVSVHILRKTCATGYYEMGVDIYTIKNILDHASVTTTQRYVKPSLVKQRAAVNSRKI